MTDLDLAHLRDLLAKATPGPWLPMPRAFGPDSKADRTLIVALVNAAPQMLDEIERCRKEHHHVDQA